MIRVGDIIMKVLLLLMKGYEQLEAAPFVDVFGWARTLLGEDVSVTSCAFDSPVISAFGGRVIPDILLGESAMVAKEYADFDALAIPGGFGQFGYYEQAYDERTLEIVRTFDEEKKPISAICTAALILGKSGILKGRRATTYGREEGRKLAKLSSFGAEVEDTPIVTEAHITTCQGPANAPEAALALLSLAIGEERTEELRHLMYY
jgi:4-methyl-5(b-hydroxyethyl)-thiazole monophosphate biosynthesis